jgi:hypothetical protein
MMNERIKQLAVQAGYLPDNFGIGHWDMPECKKFAELIIQECVQACINMGNDYEIKSAGQYQAEMFAFAIKQHFGVEE